MSQSNNIKKITFCPGPGAVINDWFSNQKEFFGRGDEEYKSIKKKTINWLKKISGQNEIIPIAGAATTAAIVAINTFVFKKVLIVKTGYYSDRWYEYLKKSKKFKTVKYVQYKDFLKLKKNQKFDWVIFVYVETASCTKYDIKKVFKKKTQLKSKLLVDATASIGLEKNHNLADVVFFSSCKGLFGPTGLGFIGYKKKCKLIKSNDFWLNYETHKKSLYTLGYNCMAALYAISKNHNKYKQKIIYANKFMNRFSLFEKNRPLIGMALNKKIKKIKIKKNTLIYIPRLNPGYDVIFFLGIIKFSYKEIKKILNSRIISNLGNSN